MVKDKGRKRVREKAEETGGGGGAGRREERLPLTLATDTKQLQRRPSA